MVLNAGRKCCAVQQNRVGIKRRGGPAIAPRGPGSGISEPPDEYGRSRPVVSAVMIRGGANLTWMNGERDIRASATGSGMTLRQGR